MAIFIRFPKMRFAVIVNCRNDEGAFVVDKPEFPVFFYPCTMLAKALYALIFKKGYFRSPAIYKAPFAVDADSFLNVCLFLDVDGWFYAPYTITMILSACTVLQ